MNIASVSAPIINLLPAISVLEFTKVLCDQPHLQRGDHSPSALGLVEFGADTFNVGVVGPNSKPKPKIAKIL